MTLSISLKIFVVCFAIATLVGLSTVKSGGDSMSAGLKGSVASRTLPQVDPRLSTSGITPYGLDNKIKLQTVHTRDPVRDNSAQSIAFIKSQTGNTSLWSQQQDQVADSSRLQLGKYLDSLWSQQQDRVADSSREKPFLGQFSSKHRFPLQPLSPTFV
jgi:hypothetical protein